MAWDDEFDPLSYYTQSPSPRPNAQDDFDPLSYYDELSIEAPDAPLPQAITQGFNPLDYYDIPKPTVAPEAPSGGLLDSIKTAYESAKPAIKTAGEIAFSPLKLAGGLGTALQEYAAGVPTEESRIQPSEESIFGFEAPSLEQLITEETIKRPAAAIGAGQPGPALPLGMSVPAAALARGLGAGSLADVLMGVAPGETAIPGTDILPDVVPRPLQQAEAVAEPLFQLGLGLPIAGGMFSGASALSPTLGRALGIAGAPEMIVSSGEQIGEAIGSKMDQGSLADPEALQGILGGISSGAFGGLGLLHGLRRAPRATEEKIREEVPIEEAAPSVTAEPEVQGPQISSLKRFLMEREAQREPEIELLDELYRPERPIEARRPIEEEILPEVIPEPLPAVEVAPERFAEPEILPERGVERRQEELPIIEDRRLAERRAAVARELQLREDDPAVIRTATAEHQARLDPLTGLGNRLALDEAMATHQGPVVSMDLGGLGFVNDNLGGHPAGDSFLKAASQAILEEPGVQGHRAGQRSDEFVLLADTPEIAKAASENIQRRFANAEFTGLLDGKPVRYTGGRIDYGVGAEGPTATERLAAGDRALYEARELAKEQGLRPSVKGERPVGLREVPRPGEFADQVGTEVSPVPSEPTTTFKGTLPEKGNVRMPSILKYREGEPVPRNIPPKAPELAGEQLRTFVESNLSNEEIQGHPWLSQEAKDLITAERSRSRPETLITEEPTGEEPKYATKAPVFFSALRKEVDSAKQPAGSGEQWVRFLSGRPGVKADEIKWTGLDDFLKERAGKRVTKQEVQEFLDQNQVEVQEVTLGKAKPSGRTVEEIDRDMDSILEELGERSWDSAPDLERRHEELQFERNAAAGLMREDTKFSQYQLPGGENYRELLLTLPPIRGRYAEVVKRIDEITNLPAKEHAAHPELRDEFDRLIEEQRQLQPPAPFQGGHFQEPNILAHVRFNERTDAQGKKVLFIEEVQSDWAQKGRREGFKGAGKLPPSYKVIEGQAGFKVFDENADIRGSGDTYEEAVANALARRGEFGIPPAPFVGSTEKWSELAMKRMVRWAAENGFDRVAWTKGEQQAARYDLSKQVDAVHAYPEKGGTWEVNAVKDGSVQLVKKGLSEKDLADTVGKDLAEKIVSKSGTPEKGAGGEEGYVYRGVDLKVGGEGMAGFYDRILPAVAGKLGKKFGAKVGEIPLSVSEPSIVRRDDGGIFAQQVERGRLVREWGPFRNEAEARQMMGRAEGPRVHSLDITPQMRASVMEGQPLFRATEKPGLGVTTDQVKQAFASGKVSEIEGGWDVSLPDKGQLSIKVTPDGIEYAEGAFKAGRGREKGGAEEIVGSYRRAGKDAIIMLSSKADLGTLHHEAWHDAKARALEADPSFAEKLKAAFRLGKLGALSKGELEAVYKRYEPDAIAKAKREGVDFGSMDERQKRSYVEEVEADKYGEWNPKTQVNGWFSKIFNFVRSLYRSFRPNWESAFERTRSGEAYGKPTATTKVGPKFASRVDKKTGEPIRPFGYDIEESGAVTGRKAVDVSRIGDYGADPVGDGTFRMVPSGDIVSATEKVERLSRNKPKFATRQEGFTASEEPFALPEMGRIVPKEGILAPKEPPKPAAEERGTILEMGVEGWKANILTGPPTQVANTAGNLLKQALTIAETALSSRVIDPALAKLQGRARERFKGEAAASFAAVRSAGPTALKQFAKDLGEIATLKPEKLQGEGRYEYKRAIPGKTGRAVRIPFRLLEAGDTAMKTLAGEQELYKQALRKFEGKAEKAGDFIRKYNSMPEAERKVAYPKVFEAIEKAKERETFQGPLDDQKFIEGAAKMISNASQKYPVLDFVFPFKKTPAKIATATLERTPYGFKYAWDKYKEYKAGKVEAGEVSDALARPILGTAIATVMASAAADGLITGSGPSDARKRHFLEETGWKPYSFVTTGADGKKIYTPFNRLEPVSSIVGMAADLFESGNEKEAGDLIDKIGGSVMENLTNKTFLAGLDGLSHAMSDPRRYLGQFAKNLAGSFVPTGVAKAAQALDPTVRYTKADEPGLAGLPETIGRTIQARIPGLSQKLPALKSPTGEDVQRPGTAFERFVSPAIRSREREGKDLEKLMVDIDYVPGQPHREMTVRHKKIRLNEEEYAIMQKSNKLAADYIRRNLLTSPSFMKADPERQKREMERIYSKARNQAKSKVQSMKSFRERALAPQ